MSKFYFQNAVLGVAYAIIDSVKTIPRLTEEKIGASLASASRSLAPAIAFAYTLGYQFGVCYHKTRAVIERHIILGGSTT